MCAVLSDMAALAMPPWKLTFDHSRTLDIRTDLICWAWLDMYGRGGMDIKRGVETSLFERGMS